MVAFILRLLVRYVKEVESIDAKVLTHAQHDCYISTLNVRRIMMIIMMTE